MKDKRQLIPAVGLAATMAGAVYMVVQLHGQPAGLTGNFSNATQAEVRGPEGQVLLSGRFQVADEQDDDIERKAVLTPSGADADAAGEAEVEISKDARAEQEVEFSVRNIAPGSTVTFVIDGVEVATATVDARGRAEIELDVPLP